MIERDVYLNQIKPVIGKHIIKVLTGVRRCGKSTLIRLIINHLINEGVDESNIVLIDFDSIETLNLQNIVQVSEFIQEKINGVNGKIYLFFDEVQRIPEWERLVNSYFNDERFDVYVTGSNSKLLSGEFATYLTGRYIEIKVYPFSFKEYVEYHNESGMSVEELFQKYLIYGGMPSSFDLKNKRQYLNDLVNSIISKDILQRFDVKNTDLLINLFNFLASNIGNLYSSKSLMTHLKKLKLRVSPNTVYNYLRYLDEACLIYEVKRYDILGKSLLNHLEKYYLVDHGIREAIFNRNLRDISQIYENIVYMELLRRGYEVNIGVIGDNEVDFLIKREDDIRYIQVTYVLENEKTFEREFGNLLKIPDNYPKYVISKDNFDRSSDGIIHLNIIDFLLNDDLIC